MTFAGHCSCPTFLKMFVLPYEVVKEQKNFGPERSRTADLLLAKQALYQLSYRPERG